MTIILLPILSFFLNISVVSMPLSDISYRAYLREWVQIPRIGQFNGTEKNDSRVVSEITSRQVYLMGTFCTLHYAVKTSGRWPPVTRIEKLRQYTGMQHYILDKNGHRIIRVRDIQMDAGSFGKGEALDRLLKENTEGDVWMVDLGGQILVHGSLPGKSGWPVAIAHPWQREDALFSIILKAGSLATSGGSERDQIVGKRRLGHIVDPRTGKPAPFNGSVSVWHERALTADILSTAMYVMCPEKGLHWADERNIAACYLVPDVKGNVKINPSRAFRKIAPDYACANINPNSALQQTVKFVKK